MWWAMALQLYSYNMVYRPGAEKSNANGLSRQPWTSNKISKVENESLNFTAKEKKGELEFTHFSNLVQYI